MKPTLLFLSLLLLAGCSKRPQVGPHEFLVEGCVKELPDSCIVQLFRPDGRILKVAAADTVIGGHFSFRDTVSATTRYCILGRGPQFPSTSVDLWVAPGSYTSITGKGFNFKTWIYESEVAEQQHVNALLNVTRTDWETAGKGLIEENRWFDWMGRHRGNDSIRRLARQKINSIRRENEPVLERMTVKELEVLNGMPVSSWWLSVMAGYAMILQYAPNHPAVPLLMKAVARMTEADRQTPAGKVIMSYVQLPEAVKTGDEMADGDLYDIDGKLHHLAELKGKYILLDFWSRGCAPCVASMPEMEEVARQYASQLAVVGISSDGEKTWKEFIREKQPEGFQWNQLGKSNPTLDIFYRVDAIPCYVLISPEGKVIDQWHGYRKNSLKEKLAVHLLQSTEKKRL